MSALPSNDLPLGDAVPHSPSGTKLTLVDLIEPGKLVMVGKSGIAARDLLAYIEARLIAPRPDCMIWAAAADRGYGRIYLDGTAQRVHRVVWELVNGPIPEGMTIDHLCRVRNCVNIDHLEVVTQAENIRRATPFRPNRRRAIDRCANGHEWTAETTGRGRNGRRFCLACKAVRDKERAARQAAVRAVRDAARAERQSQPKARVPAGARTHCRNGHELAGNTVAWRDGQGATTTRCLTCVALTQRRKDERARAARQAARATT